MVRAHDDHELVAGHLEIAEAGLHRWALDEAQVCGAGAETVEDLVGVADVERDAHAGQALLGRREPLRHEVLGNRHARAHVKGAPVPLEGVDGAGHAVRRLEDLRREASDDSTPISQLRASGRAPREGEACRGLHLLQEPRRVRLGHARLPRGGTDAAPRRERSKETVMPQIPVPNSHIASI
nr:hypothetical protein [Sinomonas albida]